MTLYQYAKSEARAWAQSGPEPEPAPVRDLMEIAYLAGMTHALEFHDSIMEAVGTKPAKKAKKARKLKKPVQQEKMQRELM